MEETRAPADIVRERRERSRPPLARRGEILAGAPPCFHFAKCRGRAAVEKGGRSLCRGCADQSKGREFPLREPTFAPIYASGFLCAEDTDMIEMAPGGTVATLSPVESSR